jgi:hypothetical protein
MKRDFKQAKQDGWDKQPRDSDGYENHVLENADFEAYYKAQVPHLYAAARMLVPPAQPSRPRRGGWRPASVWHASDYAAGPMAQQTMHAGPCSHGGTVRMQQIY